MRRRVNADESLTDAARAELPKTAVPRAKEAGAKAGYWLDARGGRGVAVVLFDFEDSARGMAERMQPGQEAGTVPGVTFKTVEVREVLAAREIQHAQCPYIAEKTEQCRRRGISDAVTHHRDVRVDDAAA